METATLMKRIWVFVINAILSIGGGFASCSPFVIIYHIHPALYTLMALFTGGIIGILLEFLILLITRGYTIGSAIIGVKFVSSGAKKMSAKQMLVRAACESVYIFAFFDLIYFLKYRTERGVIDRLSNSFAIDIYR